MKEQLFCGIKSKSIAGVTDVFVIDVSSGHTADHITLTSDFWTSQHSPLCLDLLKTELVNI